MTHDERLEIGEQLNELKQDCKRLMLRIERMQDVIGEMAADHEEQITAKEKFLINH